MSNLRQCRAAVAVALIAATAAGCSSGSGEQSSATPGSAPLTAMVNQTDLESQVVMNNALNHAIKACMAKRGFPGFDPGPNLSAANVQPESEYPAGVGLVDLTEPPASDAAPEHPGAATRPGQDDALTGGRGATEIVVTGPDGERVTLGTQGCRAEGLNAVWGSLEARKSQTLHLMEIRGAISAAADAAMKNPDVITRLDAWKQCMAAAGEKVTDPAKVAEGLPKGAHLKDWGVAQHDVGCKTTTGLAAAARRAYAQAQADYVNAHPGVITESRQIITTMMQNSRRILDTPTAAGSAGA